MSRSDREMPLIPLIRADETRAGSGGACDLARSAFERARGRSCRIPCSRSGSIPPAAASSCWRLRSWRRTTWRFRFPIPISATRRSRRWQPLSGAPIPRCSACRSDSAAAHVGLLLLAELGPERYGESEQALATRVADAPRADVRPAGAALDAVRCRARLHCVGDRGVGRRPLAARFLPAGLAGARAAASPRSLRGTRAGARRPGEQYRLAGHAGPPPWADPNLVIGREQLDLASLFAGESVVHLADAATSSAWPEGGVRGRSPAGAVHSVGARHPRHGRRTPGGASDRGKPRRRSVPRR